MSQDLKVYDVEFKGEYYSNVELSFLLGNSSPISINEVPYLIDTELRKQEDDDYVKLCLVGMYFDLSEVGEPIFEERNIKDIFVFNKKTLKGEGNRVPTKTEKDEKIQEYRKDIANRFNFTGASDKFEIAKYISSVSIMNENVFNHLTGQPTYLKEFMQQRFIFKINFLNLLTFNLNEYEKLINSNNTKILEKNLENDTFELSEASKLNQVIGLPKFAVAAVKKLKLEGMLDQLKSVASTLDGNSVKIIFEFIENTNLMLKVYISKKSKNYTRDNLNTKEEILTKFLECVEYLSKRNYKTTDLLNYVLRQNKIFHKGVCFPVDEIMFLKDYVNMNEEVDLKYEKYPANLRKTHDIISANISSLIKVSDEMEKDFEAAVEVYDYVEDIITVDKGKATEVTYNFLVPSSVKALIQEGNDLHHCVGSYGRRVIDGKSRIVFMRDAKEPKKSLVTIDIDKKGNLIEAKKSFNEEVDAIQMKAITTWTKKISK